MSGANLDDDMAAIMADLEKSTGTIEGAIRLNFLLREVGELSKLYVADETRPAALELIGQWSQNGGLRKRIADHWLARARGIVTDGVAPKKGAGAKLRKIHPLLAKWRAKHVTTGAGA